MAKIGCHSLVVTNAAGGISSFLEPGSLMWITDHIDWTFSPRTPVRAEVPDIASRMRTTAHPYDLEWMDEAAGKADADGVSTERGTYLWTRGPSYETKAEIRAFSVLGADAVGMSTVPEVVAAVGLGMRVAGISTITNFAAGISDQALDHSEVLEVGQRVRKNLEKLVFLLLECIPSTK